MSKMDRGDIFVAGMLHDLKKLLLFAKLSPGKEDYWATWHTEHCQLDDLSTQLDDQALNDLGLNKGVILEKEEQHDLIKLHHSLAREKREALKSLCNLDPVAIFALQASDKIHKALYYTGDDEEENKEGGKGSLGEIRIGYQLPCAYPFFGNPKVWAPGKGVILKTNPELAKGFDYSQWKHEWQDSTQQFVDLVKFIHQFTEKKKLLTAEALVNIQQKYLSAFSESTYLPLISMGFHLRLVTSIILLLYGTLKNLCFKNKTAKTQITLDLKTILTPEEKLRHRLKDISAVRKISHLLQEKIHGYLRDTYLKELADRDFSHPDCNPFLFYNKDALVLICCDTDHEELARCCHEVAKKTGTIITMETLRVHIPLTLLINKNDIRKSRDGKLLSKLDPVDVEKVEFPKEIKIFEPTIEQFYPLEDMISNEEQSCHTCGRPGRWPQDELGDRLCNFCNNLRWGFDFCYSCKVYVEKNTEGKCNYCSKDLNSPPIPLLLQSCHINEDPKERIAYLMVRTNCYVDTIKVEAEIQMARYQVERQQFHPKVPLHFLASTRSTYAGLYEYLQAVLDIGKFQERMRNHILALSSARGDREPAAEGHFLYRSPRLAVVMVAEHMLREFWDRVKEDLKQLNLSYLVQAVACPAHYPVWAVLRHFLRPVEFLPHAAEKAQNRRTKAVSLHRQVDKLMKGKKSEGREEISPGLLKESKKILELSREVWDTAQCDREEARRQMRMRILRGSIEREFDREAMEFLFEEAGNWQGEKPPFAQLGEISGFAARLTTLSPKNLQQEDLRATLEMELDARSHGGAGKEKIPKPLVKRLKRQIRSLRDVTDTSALVRELAARIKLEGK